ncbi:MAG: calcium-binding protein [Nitrospira sp.]
MMATLIGTSNNNNLNGTAAADTMVGLAGNDQLLGNGGDDRLNGGTQNDVLNGGTGIDTADYSNLVIGGLTYIGATAGVTVNLNLTSAQNTIGAGTDTLTSIENLIGTNFADALAGNGAANILTGLGGNDIMAGAAGNDQLLGGDGNDLLSGGVGNDLLNGGAGSDAVDYSTFTIAGQAIPGATAGVSVNLSLTGAQNTGGAGTDTLVSIEDLNGSNFNDTLTGTSGNNVLKGRAGNDTLNGGAGNDKLEGEAGNDTLNGGTGFDTASYAAATAGVTVDLFLPDGFSQNTGGAGIDTLVSMENLIGSNFNDNLNSAYFDLTTPGFVNGGAGNDVVTADHAANLTLNGDSGNDIMGGNASTATLNGGDGDDQLGAYDGTYTLNGGNGNDRLRVEADDFLSDCTLNGGAGADILEHPGSFLAEDVILTFDYNSVSESPAGVGRDIIMGFIGHDSFGGQGGDRIDLTTIDANTLASGNQAFTYIGSAAFTAAGQLRYAGGLLQGSTDADAAAEFEIQLVGSPALTVGGAGTDILL